jgi:hypothetical protein
VRPRHSRESGQKICETDAPRARDSVKLILIRLRLGGFSNQKQDHSLGKIKLQKLLAISAGGFYYKNK